MVMINWCVRLRVYLIISVLCLDVHLPSAAEPSDDLLMNVSRCRRLVIVLTGAYLEHEWCTDSFQYETPFRYYMQNSIAHTHTHTPAERECALKFGTIP